MTDAVISMVASHLPDRIGSVIIVVVAAATLYIATCMREKRKTNVNGWDVTVFASSAASAIGASYMLVEAAFNVGAPPPHWRLYVGVLSLGLVFHLGRKCYDMWPQTLENPPEGTGAEVPFGEDGRATSERSRNTQAEQARHGPPVA